MKIIAKPKTFQLKPYLTWVSWNGTIAQVKRLVLDPKDPQRRFIVVLDRFNSTGTKIGSPELVVGRNAIWHKIQNPNL